MWHAWERGEKCRGKPRRKKTTWQPNAWMEERDQNGPYGDWLGGGGGSGLSWLRIGTVGNEPSGSGATESES
jgi:hypothetical protein